MSSCIYPIINSKQIDDESRGGCINTFFTGNPNITQFRNVYQRCTHYRKFPVELKNENENENENGNVTFTINHTEFDKINAISDLTITIKGSSKLRLIDEISQYFERIQIKMGNQVIFELLGKSLMDIFSLYGDIYDKVHSAFRNTGELCIPIQYFMEGNNTFNLYGLKHDLVISCELLRKPKSINCYASGYKLTSDETSRNSLCSERLIWMYSTIIKKDTNEVTLTNINCISDIVVSIPADQVIYTKLNEIPLLRGDHPLLMCYRNSSDTYLYDNRYYYHSDIDPNQMLYSPFGGYITGGSSTKLSFSSKCAETRILLKYKGIIRSKNGNIQIVSGNNPKEHTNFYPLTKLDNNNFIEGYWSSVQSYEGDEDENYPFPQATDIPVDNEFLTKLNNVIKQHECDKIGYFGFSCCRLCE